MSCVSVCGTWPGGRIAANPGALWHTAEDCGLHETRCARGITFCRPIRIGLSVPSVLYLFVLSPIVATAVSRAKLHHCTMLVLCWYARLRWQRVLSHCLMICDFLRQSASTSADGRREYSDRSVDGAAHCTARQQFLWFSFACIGWFTVRQQTEIHPGYCRSM